MLEASWLHIKYNDYRHVSGNNADNPGFFDRLLFYNHMLYFTLFIIKFVRKTTAAS